MSVWLAIPSARPAAEAKLCLDAWRSQGYKIALWLDEPRGRKMDASHEGDVVMSGSTYPGYARAVNTLIAHVMSVVDPQAEWFVTGGDDVWPDPTKRADEIACECSEQFYNSVELAYPPSRPKWADIPLPSPGGSGKDAPSWIRWSTFGVMQPTGHRWGDAQGAYIDRVCGSPWMGREWCRRANQGRGPLYDGFTHMHVDECLFEVAKMLGVLWQRPDLTHMHKHWGLPREGERMGQSDRMPEFLKRWNTPEHWRESKALLERLRADGFKECLPL